MIIPVIFAGMLPFRSPYRGKGAESKEKIYSFLRTEFATRRQDARALWRALMHSDSAIRVLFIDLDEKIIQRIEYSPEEKELLAEREPILNLLSEIEEIEQEVKPLLQKTWEEGTEEINWSTWEDIKKRLVEKSKVTISKIEALRAKCIKYRTDERHTAHLARVSRTREAAAIESSQREKIKPAKTKRKKNRSVNSQNSLIANGELKDPREEFRLASFRDLAQLVDETKQLSAPFSFLSGTPDKLCTDKLRSILASEVIGKVLSSLEKIKILRERLQILLMNEWESEKVEESTKECRKIIDSLRLEEIVLRSSQDELIQLSDRLKKEKIEDLILEK